MNMPDGWSAIPAKDLALLERYAARYNWLRNSVQARVGIATEAMNYEKMDAPPAEWLDSAIDAEIGREG